MIAFKQLFAVIPPLWGWSLIFVKNRVAARERGHPLKGKCVHGIVFLGGITFGMPQGCLGLTGYGWRPLPPLPDHCRAHLRFFPIEICHEFFLVRFLFLVFFSRHLMWHIIIDFCEINVLQAFFKTKWSGHMDSRCEKIQANPAIPAILKLKTLFHNPLYYQTSLWNFFICYN